MLHEEFRSGPYSSKWFPIYGWLGLWSLVQNEHGVPCWQAGTHDTHSITLIFLLSYLQRLCRWQLLLIHSTQLHSQHALYSLLCYQIGSHRSLPLSHHQEFHLSNYPGTYTARRGEIKSEIYSAAVIIGKAFSDKVLQGLSQQSDKTYIDYTVVTIRWKIKDSAQWGK